MTEPFGACTKIFGAMHPGLMQLNEIKAAFIRIRDSLNRQRILAKLN